MIDVVRNMTRDHIKGNTLILLTITMRDDIDNQGAADLAHTEDPQGLRTIGVLTKPDTIQKGEEHAWLGILEGRSHQLKHGYFVTKQRSPEQLEQGMTFDEARQHEALFFQNQYPWKENKNLRNRMGTPSLTAELSKLLGAVINQALPELRKKSKDSHHEVKSRLDNLPPPPSDNPSAELLRLVTGFSTEVAQLIRGSEGYEQLIQQCRPAFAKFKQDIRSTAPDFRPFTDERDEPREECVPEEDMGGSVPVTPDPMYLSDVRDHIQRSLTRELPFNVPFRAKVSLIEKFSSNWGVFSDSCFEQVHKAALFELKQFVDSKFSQVGSSSGLWDHVSTIVEDQVERARVMTQERIEWMLGMENPPFTLNDHYFASYREKYLAEFKAARAPQALDPDDVNAVMSALARLGTGFRGLQQRDLFKLVGSDKYEEEMIVMAETAAYFHVSYKRIIDNIPRIIDHDFLRTIEKEIQDALIEGLALGSENAMERAAMYLAEDEGVSEERKMLGAKLDRLDEVLKRLFNFGM